MKTMRARMTISAILALGVALGVGCGSAKKTVKGPDASGGRGENAPQDNGGAIPERPTDTMSSYDLADIHFDFDRYDLRSQDREMLSRHAEWLASNVSVRLRIEGHCDERGTVEYNLALGEKRARTAQAFLENYGIAASRLEVVSYGKERPLDPGHDESAWAKNRRDTFVKR